MEEDSKRIIIMTKDNLPVLLLWKLRCGLYFVLSDSQRRMLCLKVFVLLKALGHDISTKNSN